MTAPTRLRERIAEFLDADYGRVVGAVALATGDRDRAEDAVQDALVKTLTGDTEPDNLAGWVTVVAINFVRQSWRRADAQGRAYVRAATWDDLTDAEAQRTTDAIAVSSALGRLPERQRMAVVLHYYEGLSVAEVAHTLGISTGTVKTQLSRGRDNLGNHLRKEASR